MEAVVGSGCHKRCGGRGGRKAIEAMMAANVAAAVKAVEAVKAHGGHGKIRGACTWSGCEEAVETPSGDLGEAVERPRRGVGEPLVATTRSRELVLAAKVAGMEKEEEAQFPEGSRGGVVRLLEKAATVL